MGMILTILVRGHPMMFQTKYECFQPYVLSQEDFKIGCTWAEPKYDSRGIILTILVEDHQIMLHTKYECSSHYGLSEEDFLKLSFFVSM